MRSSAKLYICGEKMERGERGGKHGGMKDEGS